MNGAYKLEATKALSSIQIAEADVTTGRVIKRVEALFRLMSDGTPMLDHYTPAEWLMANPAMLDGNSEEVVAALARAETLFEAYNSML